MRPKLQMSDTTQVLIGLYGPAMIMSFGQGMVVPTIPTLASTFGVSPGLAAQLVTASMLGRILVGIPTGQLVDRFGRKPILLAGPTIVGVASLLTAMAPTFWLLLAAQFAVGLGLNAWIIAREVAAVDVVRPELRGRMMSGFHGMSSVGVAVGPVLGGIVTDHFGFRAVFVTYALISFITLLISLRVRETAGIAKAERSGLFNVGRVSEVEPAFRSTYVVLTFNTFVAMMRGALITSLIPLYVGIQLGHSSTEIGSWFGLYGLANVLMIVPTGVLSDRRGRKSIVMPSAYLAVLIFIAFPLATGTIGLSALALLMGVSSGLALGSMATYTYDVIPAHARARLQALRRLFGDLGSISGPAIGGLIADLVSPSAVFWVFVPLQLVAGLAITFLAKESLHHVRARDAGAAASR